MTFGNYLFFIYLSIYLPCLLVCKIYSSSSTPLADIQEFFFVKLFFSNIQTCTEISEGRPGQSSQVKNVYQLHKTDDSTSNESTC